MKKLAMVVFLGGVIAPATLLAAEEGPPSREVVVTATPLDVPLRETLQGATALGREEVLATLGSGLGETLERQPGVASTFFGAGASRPIIRGLGEDRIRILSSGLGQIDVSTISPDHAVAAEAIEASGIEVLRGPAALLYGGNAIGGVVNVLDSRIPETRPERAVSAQAFLSAESGTDAEVQSLGATLAAGAFALRLEGFNRASENYDIPGFALSAEEREEEIAEGVDPATFANGTAPNSFTDGKAGAIGASFIGERGFLGASFRRLEQVYGIPGHAHEAGGGGPPAVFEGPRIELEQDRAELRGLLRNPLPGLKSVRGDLAVIDYRHAEIEDTGEEAIVFTNEGLEARVEFAHAGLAGFDGVFGASGFQQDFAAVGIEEESFVSPTKTLDYGVFAVERGQIGPVALEFGGRYERREHDNEVEGERAFDTVSASLGASVRPTERLFLAATLSRAERAPTELELFALGEHAATNSYEIGDTGLDKETALSIEGVARWSAGPLSLEANLYRAEFEDFIALIPTGQVFVEPLDQILDPGDPLIPPDAETVDVFRFLARDARFTGGEIAARFAVLEEGRFTLAFDGALDFVRGEFETGGDVPRIPPRTLTVGVDAAAGRLSGRLEWVSVAEQDDVAAFESATEGYELLNASAALRLAPGDDRVVLMLDGRNLTDEEARVHTSFVKDLLPRPGRTVRVALALRY